MHALMPQDHPKRVCVCVSECIATGCLSTPRVLVRPQCRGQEREERRLVAYCICLSSLHDFADVATHLLSSIRENYLIRLTD